MGLKVKPPGCIGANKCSKVIRSALKVLDALDEESLLPH